MKWYKHDPAAFLEGVMELTAQERGFYITLIDLLYARDGHAVRDELVCSAMRCNPRTWRAVKRRLIACGKVREQDGNLTANRVEWVLNEARIKGQLSTRSSNINELAEGQNRFCNSPCENDPPICEYLASQARTEGEFEAGSGNINGLAGVRAPTRIQKERKKEYTSYVAAHGESQKLKKKERNNRSARSLATALNGSALTRSPKAGARPTKISDELTAMVAAKHKNES